MRDLRYHTSQVGPKQEVESTTRDPSLSGSWASRPDSASVSRNGPSLFGWRLLCGSSKWEGVKTQRESRFHD